MALTRPSLRPPYLEEPYGRGDRHDEYLVIQGHDTSGYDPARLETLKSCKTMLTHGKCDDARCQYGHDSEATKRVRNGDAMEDHHRQGLNKEG